MRNLKKVLSLALALVMLVGMMTIGAGAATYTDSDQVTKAEAVDVMSGIGVLTGTDTGAFNPKGNLNREQAAKILAIATLGPTVANILSASGAPFADVPANSWSAGYIAYCSSSAGGWIITGRDDGLFHPWDLVTGTEFAKMLLVAIGNDPYRYVGDVWAINTQTDAVKAGLINNVGITNWNAAITREQAAQMAFNAINIGETVTITATKFIVASTDHEWTSGKTFADKAGNVNGGTYDSFDEAKAKASAVVLSDTANATTPKAVYGVDYTITSMVTPVTVTKNSLAQNVFKLSSTPGTDEYGNPCKEWYVEGNPQPIAVVETGTTLEYATAVTGGQLYTALGLTPTSQARLTVKTIIDGKTNENNATVKGYIVSGDTNPIAGAGALTKVYKSGDSLTITVVNTYVAKIASFTPAVLNANGQVETKSYITLDITTNLNAGNQKPGAASGTLTATYNTTAFSKADEGAVVLYTALETSTADTYAIDTVKKVEPVTVTPTRITGTGVTSTFVANGATYNYSCQAVAPVSSVGAATVLYFDNYGNVIYTTAPQAAAKNYAVIIGLAPVAGGGQGTLAVAGAQQAMLLLADGTNTTVTIVPNKNGKQAWQNNGTAVFGYADLIAAAGGGTESGKDPTEAKHDQVAAVNPAEHDVVTYTVNNKGEYVVTLVSNSAASLTGVATNVPTIASSVVANSKTIFLVRSSTDTTKTAFTVYTGIGAVPTLTLTGATERIVTKDGVATLVYVNGCTVGSSSTTAKDLVFIAAGTAMVTNTELVGSNSVTTYTYPAVVNGQIGTVVALVNDIDTGLYKSLTYSSGVVSAKPGSSDEADGFDDGTGLLDCTHVDGTPANGVIAFDGTGTSDDDSYYYNDDTAVYAVNTTTGAITASSISKLEDDTEVYAVYVVDNIVTAIFYKAT